MADLSMLRGSFGEVEFILLNNWTPFQRELFLFSCDIDRSPPAPVEDSGYRHKSPQRQVQDFPRTK
jgi:hypothetical protein